MSFNKFSYYSLKCASSYQPKLYKQQALIAFNHRAKAYELNTENMPIAFDKIVIMNNKSNRRYVVEHQKQGIATNQSANNSDNCCENDMDTTATPIFMKKYMTRFLMQWMLASDGCIA